MRLASFSDEELHLNKYGDIHPSESGPVLVGAGGKLKARAMRWGFPSTRSKQLLINARAETALVRPTFAESVRRRRCVIAAAGFYEWDAKKTKVSYFLPGERTIYMAGFYKRFDGEERFVILTTEANESVRDVHERMPVILARSEVAEWVFSDVRTEEFLGRKGPVLKAVWPVEEYEQLKLF